MGNKIIWSILILLISFAACSKNKAVRQPPIQKIDTGCQKNDEDEESDIQQEEGKTVAPPDALPDIRNLTRTERRRIFKQRENPYYALYSDEYREECIEVHWDDLFFLMSIRSMITGDMNTRVGNRIRKLYKTHAYILPNFAGMSGSCDSRRV